MTTLTTNKTNMTTTFKYSINDINNISYQGFNYEVPENVMDLIRYLSGQVGFTGSLRSPIFKKRDVDVIGEPVNNSNNLNNRNKKRKGNKQNEITDEEWESLRTFQPTKFAEKVGIDIHIDTIRTCLNKLTDKLFNKIRDEIFDTMNKIIAEGCSDEDMSKVGFVIFDICSTTKFYSKLFADLYCEMVSKFVFLKPTFNNYYTTYKELFNNIEYVEPDVNYDQFCEINKVNQKRRSFSQFLVSLSLNGFLDKTEIIKLLVNLLNMVLDLINKDGNKNIVDEITENIVILYNKELISYFEDNDLLDDDEYTINNDNIVEVVNKLSLMKSKDFKSLTNKSVFKFMDLCEQ
jgi:hypothetical protein